MIMLIRSWALLLAVSACNGGTTVTPAPYDGPSVVASVRVTIDSVSLALDAVAQATAKARDASGSVISDVVFTWQSLSPGVAAVSETGEVIALAAGSAVIEATTAGKSGAASIAVRVPLLADMAAHDFDEGTLGPYATWGEVDVIDDPTGSGRGKVVHFRYEGSDGDDNRALVFKPKVGFRQSIFFRGEFYLPVASLGDDQMQRKLIYWKQHVDYEKYPGSDSHGGRRYRTVIKMFGDELHVDAVYEPQNGDIDGVRTYGKIAEGMLPNHWYSLEVQQTNESSIGAGDGVLKVWLDGVLKFRKTNMRWSDPAWIGQPVPGSRSLLEPADLYWDTFMVGQQVNLFKASFDEHRYWNNVAFSTTRIGP